MDCLGTRYQALQFSERDIGELGAEQGRTPWLCNNQAAIMAAKTCGFNGRTRHVDIKLKFTRQEHELGKVEILYVPTDKQLADGLAKRLRKEKTSGWFQHYFTPPSNNPNTH